MNQIVSFIENGAKKLVGITGGAGSGKSTLTAELAAAMDLPTFHIDSAFIGDSTYRKTLMRKKAERSEESLLDMEEQYNWWDWDLVESRVGILKKYSKSSLVEGAIFGPPAVVNMFDVILFLDIPERIRLARLLDRDSFKRTEEEIFSRFVLTNKSEQKYYEFLFKNFKSKIYRINEEYKFI